MDFINVYPNYRVTKEGKIFKNGEELKPFKSNDYIQVLLFDNNHRRHVLGVHTVVAMMYLDYFKGCSVHHKDGNKHNNCVDNLEVYAKGEHTRLHNKDNMTLANYIKENGPANKGKKMSKEFCQHCSVSAKKRGFNGNQFCTKDGTRRV